MAGFRTVKSFGFEVVIKSLKRAELLKWFFRMESKAVKEGKSIIFNQEFLHDILSLRFTRAERKMINYLWLYDQQSSGCETECGPRREGL